MQQPTKGDAYSSSPPTTTGVPVQQQGGGSIPVAIAQVVQPVGGQAYTGQPMAGTGQPGVQYVVQTQQVYFGSYPQRVVCPICHYDVVTGTVKEVGMISHLWAIGLCLVGCWPCCLLPYCMDACKDTAHYCPNCHSQIGYFRSI